VTAREWLEVVGAAGSWTLTAWTWAAMCIYLRKLLPRGNRSDRLVNGARHMYHEIRPFYVFLCCVAAVKYAADGFNWTDVISNGVHVLNWYLYRDVDDDDDRWKRRREKLREKIEQVGGKLVVAPAPTPT
jgi:hypothetical protein